MKTKIYLIILLIVIMGAGARTMFEIAYHGMAFEHGASPNAETYPFIAVALWYVVMMVLDVMLIRNKNLKGRNVYIGLLSVAVFVPAIYMFMTK